MKNMWIFFLTVLMVSGCLSYEIVSYRPGIYGGESRGFRGNVRVTVLVSENGIEDIEIEENGEDAWAAETMEELRELVLETGSTDNDDVIDAVSGATVSGTAFLNAVENALSAAMTKREIPKAARK